MFIILICMTGGKAMDKKQRKKWQAQLLERLGAKADKAPRCSAKIGQGMMKKRAQREARAFAEAVASGVVRVKGMGKKKRAEKGEQLDVRPQQHLPIPYLN